MKIYKYIVGFIKNNYFIIILSFSSIITLLPLLRYGFLSVYYHVDPDVVYVGNAIAYVKYKIIHYSGHPGTPSILILAWSYWPLRVIAKLIDHKPFVLWCFDNLRFLFMYSRIIYFSIFTLSLFMYFKSVKAITKSYITLIAAASGLFIFVPFFELGSKISAENTTFFVISLWLFVFIQHIKKSKVYHYLILSLLSGIGLAVKLNNIVLPISTFLIILFSYGDNLKRKSKMFIGSVLTTIIVFFLSTWSIRTSYTPMFARFTRVMGQSGIDGAHGVGNTQFINILEYFQTIKNFMSGNTWPFIIMVTATLVIAYLYFRNSEFNKHKKFVFPLLIGLVCSTLILFKYPLPYYQLPNYIIYVFLASYVFDKLSLYKKLLIILLLMPSLISTTNSNLFYASQRARSAVSLEMNLVSNPAQKATLWDYGPTQDFAYIWIRSWVRGMFTEELNTRPDLLELDVDNEKVYVSTYDKPVKVWNICWDKLYLRKSRLNGFLEKYPEKILNYHEIDRSGIILIESDHCI